MLKFELNSATAIGVACIGYIWFIGLMWWQITYPLACPHDPASHPEKYRGCFEPLLKREDRISLYMYTGMGDHPPQGHMWAAHNLDPYAAFETSLTVPIPHDVRLHGAALSAWLVLSRANVTEMDAHGNPVQVPDPRQRIVCRAQLTAMDKAYAVPAAHSLLGNGEKKTGAASASAVAVAGHKRELEVLQHWKYGRHPLTLRLVHFGNTTLHGAELPDLGQTLHVRRVHSANGDGRPDGQWQNVYEPLVYVDDLSLLRRQRAQMSDNVSWPDPVLRLSLSPTSPGMHAYKSVISAVLEHATALQFLGEAEVDELRYWMSDDRIFRYFLTQAVSLVHLLLEYLAFRDDWRFFVGRKSFTGVSTSSIAFGVLRSAVIFLYLLDADTSVIVLFTVGKDVLWAAYKLYKIAKPRLYVPAAGSGATLPLLPRLTWMETEGMTDGDKEVATYDTYATRHVSLAVYPLVLGMALYQLLNFRYSSWWSWIIGSLADSVYTFGFIAMCPQLYINYRMQSVAHLPMGAFGYKIFNTFVDDAFAFIVKMPLKHRIMTLRDDVVFLGFVYQWWVYRTDKARVNEFGFKYDGGEGEGEGEGEGGSAAAIADLPAARPVGTPVSSPVAVSAEAYLPAKSDNSSCGGDPAMRAALQGLLPASLLDDCVPGLEGLDLDPAEMDVDMDMDTAAEGDDDDGDGGGSGLRQRRTAQ